MCLFLTEWYNLGVQFCNREISSTYIHTYIQCLQCYCYIFYSNKLISKLLYFLICYNIKFCKDLSTPYKVANSLPFNFISFSLMVQANGSHPNC